MVLNVVHRELIILGFGAAMTYVGRILFNLSSFFVLHYAECYYQKTSC
jgi:uncharacterized membrane protein YjjB (DUF3815 family)